MNPYRLRIEPQEGPIRAVGPAVRYPLDTRLRCLDCGWTTFHQPSPAWREPRHWCPAAEHPMYAAAKAALGQFDFVAPWYLKKHRNELGRAISTLERALVDEAVRSAGEWTNSGWGAPE